MAQRGPGLFGAQEVVRDPRVIHWLPEAGALREQARDPAMQGLTSRPWDLRIERGRVGVAGQGHEKRAARDVPREQALFDSWKAKQDEKPAGTTRQGTRHWPH